MGRIKAHLEDQICDSCHTFIEHKDYKVDYGAIICENCYITIEENK